MKFMIRLKMRLIDYIKQKTHGEQMERTLENGGTKTPIGPKILRNKLISMLMMRVSSILMR
jgi:hypothetical protein